MKQTKNEKQKDVEFLETPLKRGIDKVYQMILANGLFILFNLHILLGFIFIEPGNIVLFYIILGLLSFNIFPSYAALTKVMKLPASEDQKVMKEYFNAYKKSFAGAFFLGTIGIFIMVNTMMLNVFFLTQGNTGLSQVMQGLFVVVFVVTLALVYLHGDLEGTFGKTIKTGFKNLIYLLPGAAASMLISVIGLMAGGVFRMMLIIGFSLGALAQIKLSKKVMSRINQK